MKHLIKYLTVILVAISFIACSDDPPGMRVQNQNLNKANVQIKTVANTINQNDVQPGTTTNFQEVPEGRVEITAVIQNETVSPTSTFNAQVDHNYTIVILNSNPPAIRIDAANK